MLMLLHKCYKLLMRFMQLHTIMYKFAVVISQHAHCCIQDRVQI